MQIGVLPWNMSLLGSLVISSLIEDDVARTLLGFVPHSAPTGANRTGARRTGDTEWKPLVLLPLVHVRITHTSSRLESKNALSMCTICLSSSLYFWHLRCEAAQHIRTAGQRRLSAARCSAGVSAAEGWDWRPTPSQRMHMHTHTPCAVVASVWGTKQFPARWWVVQSL